METKNEYDRILMWDKTLVGMQCLPTCPEIVRDLDLRARLLRTCVKYGGVGVAAPQIGVELQVALVNYEDTTRLLINPEIVESGEETSEFWEGCLSWPLCSHSGVRSYEGGKVSRPDRIVVKYLSDAGEETTEEFKDFLAHIVQHELAHLRGEFYVDLLSPLQRAIVMRKYQRFRKQFEVA